MIRLLWIVTYLSISTFAHASQYTCRVANAGVMLDYTLDVKDGGAARPSKSKLVFDGIVLLEESAGFDPIERAQLVRNGEKIMRELLPPVNDYQEEKYYQQVIVVSTEDPSLIYFSGIVFCKDTIYVGPPRPGARRQF